MRRAPRFAFAVAVAISVALPVGAAFPQSERSADGNPQAPTTDPSMKRVRAVALPGRDSPRDEKTGLPHRGLKGSVIDESGFGSVRKPEADSYVTTAFPPRIVYLNGANVSSVRGETLENVQVRIDEEGNVHITAPHYEVSQDTSFHPLLPTELPRLPKARSRPLDLPEGRYSKDPARAPRAKGGASRGAPPRVPAPKVEVLDEGSFFDGPAGSGQDGADVVEAGGAERRADRGAGRDADRGADANAGSGERARGGARALRVGDDPVDARTEEEGARGAKGVPAR